MASNNRTPKSVLHAPTVERIFVHETKGPNRAERRHGAAIPYTDESGTKHAWLPGAVFPNLYIRGPFRPGSFAESYPTDNVPHTTEETP